MIRSRYAVLGGALALAALASATLLRAAHRPPADDAKPEIAMMEAVNRFLATLSPEQRKSATFPFDSDQRLNWQFRRLDRKGTGLPLKEMTAAQRSAAMALLKTGLSGNGYQKAAAIRELERIQEAPPPGRTPPVQDPEAYYFSVYGEPSMTGVWAWRYEGHHCALNWTVVGGKGVASSPSFFGTIPAEVREEVAGAPPKGTRPLGKEEDTARKLVTSLSEAQRKECITGDMPPTNIVTGSARVAAIQEDTGISYKELNEAQRKTLLAVIRAFADNQVKTLADRRMEEIGRAGYDKVKFAWMGSVERGKGHYFRVQGPTFLIEYDNTQSDANHVHYAWRDFKGDFGRDLLAEHYQASPHRIAHLKQPHEHGGTAHTH